MQTMEHQYKTKYKAERKQSTNGSKYSYFLLLINHEPNFKFSILLRHFN